MHLTTYWWIVGGCDVLYEKIVNPCHGQLSLFIRRIHHCTMPSGDGAQSPNSVVVRSDRPWLLVARLFPHQPTIARSSAQDIDGKQYQPRQPVEAVVVMSLGVLTTVVHRVLNQVAIAHESGLSRHPMFGDHTVVRYWWCYTCCPPTNHPWTSNATLVKLVVFPS